MSGTGTPGGPTHDRPDADDVRPAGARAIVTRIVLIIVVAVFVVFWTWALFFASKEAINKIDDRAWAERAEQICTAANADRIELSDFRPIVEGDAAMMSERADIIDKATDIIETMLDDVVAVTPVDDKGQEIVPLWEDEYREYIAARRSYADDIRRTGENLAFYEPAVDALPISERLATFAGDNEMSSCAPPYDLSR